MCITFCENEKCYAKGYILPNFQMKTLKLNLENATGKLKGRGQK